MFKLKYIFDNHLSNILVKYAFYTVSRISLDSLSLTGLYTQEATVDGKEAS